MRRATIALATAAALVVAGVAIGHGALGFVRRASYVVPPYVAYRGMLTNAAGDPVADGQHTVTFRLYETATAVSPVWEETRDLKTVGGYFNVFLGDVEPLSPRVFDGNDMHLGVQVAGDVEMLPRQRLASVPFAMRAATAADADTVGLVPVSDLALKDHTHPGQGGAAATPDADVVQLRIGTGCVAGEAIREVRRDGTVVCEPVAGAPPPPPAATAIPGATPAPTATPTPTATASATPPAPTPTAAPAAGGFRVALPGGSTVSTTELCDMQRAMAATVPSYQISVDCVPSATTVVDGGSPARVCVSRDAFTGTCLARASGASHVGSNASMAIGDDGIPVIAYLDETLETVRIARCDDRRCTGAQVSVVDAAGPLGGEVSLALRSDGRPLVAYVSREEAERAAGVSDFRLAPPGVLKLAVCADPQCSSAGTVVVDASGPGRSAGATSLALFPGDLPVMSYNEGDWSRDLKVARCLDPACSAVEINTVEAYDSGDAGLSTSIAIGSDGNPLIAYHKNTTLWSGGPAEGLKVAHCHDPSCSSSEAAVLDEIDVPSSFWTVNVSLAIDPAGWPMIAYDDPVSGTVKAARCVRQDCSPQVSGRLPGGGSVGSFRAVISTVDTVGDSVMRASLGFGAGGFPVITYGDGAAETRMLAVCGDADCSTGTTRTLDAAPAGNEYGSLAVDANGVPVIAYLHVDHPPRHGPVTEFGYPERVVTRDYTFADGKLKVIHCGNPRCEDVGP